MIYRFVTTNNFSLASCHRYAGINKTKVCVGEKVRGKETTENLIDRKHNSLKAEKIFMSH